MLFYRAAVDLSSSTLNYLAGLVRRHRTSIGSPWALSVSIKAKSRCVSGAERAEVGESTSYAEVIANIRKELG